MITAPVHLTVRHTVSPGEDVHFRGLAEGKLIGQRCPVCRKVYVPSGEPARPAVVLTGDNVELPDQGTVHHLLHRQRAVPGASGSHRPMWPPTFCSTAPTSPSCTWFSAAARTRCGWACGCGRSWRPRSEWDTTTRNIDHFRPTGEQDAPFESYANHL
jgi:hypothetical protein